MIPTNISSHPAISVCMPCYNAESYLKECLNSILDQSFTDFELLIVDDGSTDRSVEIIQSYDDARIRLIKGEHDFIAALNRLLDEATGRYIARMDADDVMLPDRLLTQYTYMEHHLDVDILSTGMELFGTRNGYFRPLVRIKPLELKDFVEGNPLSHPTVMMRAERIRQTNLRYQSEYIYAEDYKLWIEAYKAGLVIDQLPTILLRYRSSPRQNSTQYYIKQQKTTDLIRQEVKELIEKNSLETQ